MGMPADPLLAIAVDRVVEAYHLTGWRPGRSPLKPVVHAWRGDPAPDWAAFDTLLSETKYMASGLRKLRRQMEVVWTGSKPPSAPHSRLVIDGHVVGVATMLPSANRHLTDDMRAFTSLLQHNQTHVIGIHAVAWRHP